VIHVNYFCRLATTILAGPECGRGYDDPTAVDREDEVALVSLRVLLLLPS
jgi:hypothetical protein